MGVDAWRGSNDGTWASNPLAESRASDAWRRINERPSSVQFIRGSSKLDAQTVRVEVGSSANVPGHQSGQVVQQVVIYGVRDHPTVADTDMRRGDRLVMPLDGTNTMEIHIINVILQTGEIQGIGEIHA